MTPFTFQNVWDLTGPKIPPQLQLQEGEGMGTATAAAEKSTGGECSEGDLDTVVVQRLQDSDALGCVAKTEPVMRRAGKEGLRDSVNHK